jgi:hypothetical protein
MPSLPHSLHLQCAWRVRTAQKMLYQLRIAYGAAIFLQCRWRIFRSKRELHQRRIQRASSLQIQRRFRGFYARRRCLQLMKEFHPHNFMILLKTVTLNQATPGGGASGAPVPANVSMIITSYTTTSTDGSGSGSEDIKTQQKTGAKNTKRADVVHGLHGPTSHESYHLRSWTQSKQINDTSSPVWNEELCVTNSTWNSQLVLTLVEHGRFGKHSIIGQSIIAVSSLPSLLYQKGQKVDLISIPMEIYTIPVKDSSGKDLVPLGSSSRGGATSLPRSLSSTSSIHAMLWCSIRLPPLTHSMCGWVWRLPSRSTSTLSSFPPLTRLPPPPPLPLLSE